MQFPDALRISPSGLRAYDRCPYGYAVAHVRPLPEIERRPVPALALGTAVHAAAARFLRSGGWQRRGLDELLGLLNLAWDPRAYIDPYREAADYERARGLVQQFFEEPYPRAVVKELGIERSAAWSRPRRGILAVGKMDRVCLLPDNVLEVVDLKTGRVPRQPEHLRSDPQALMYRSLARDCFKQLAPDRIVVAFRFIGAATTIAVEYGDRDEFRDLWARHVETAVEAIQAARRELAAGEQLATAFPRNRGAHCAGCRFGAHCDREVGPISGAATGLEVRP